MKVLVTGAAGFIGSHLTKRLVADGNIVVAIDNYSIADQTLQHARSAWVGELVEVWQCDVTDVSALEVLFEKHAFERVFHLAAKPGVRESLTNPFAYAQANYVGTLNVLECARRHGVAHTLIASSSSVYGKQTNVPFSETDSVDEPISIYASTKRAGELLAYTYHHLYKMDITNLRFFTVYGPYGRPDMAPWIFTEKILKGEPITIYDHGNHQRDFTFINDIVAGCVGVADAPDGFSAVNLGNGNPVELMDFIATIESITGVEAKKEFVEAQPGDVNVTYADISRAKKLFGYEPATSHEVGMKHFIHWYREYAQP